MNVQNKKNLYIFVFLCIFVYLGSLVVRDFKDSLFLHPRERINIVLYDEHPTIYSLGVKDVGDYAVLFYPDLRIRVPGGYGRYRVGALGKLVYLENKPDIFRKSFTADISTFIDFYFYTKSEEVYYGEEQRDINSLRPNIFSLLWQSSNASFFDKIYLAYLMNTKQNRDFEVISYLSYKEVQGDKVFAPREFIRQFQGVFYQTIFREENKNVQIQYVDNFSQASSISSILVGTGIRVSDISRAESSSKDEQCMVIENTESFSVTTNRIADFFGCKKITGETNIYDILFILGDGEERWKISKLTSSLWK